MQGFHHSGEGFAIKQICLVKDVDKTKIKEVNRNMEKANENINVIKASLEDLLDFYERTGLGREETIGMLKLLREVDTVAADSYVKIYEDINTRLMNK